MLVAKRVVDTLAVDPHVLHQVLDRSSLVTARPENLHSPMEDFIAIELFLARHSCSLGYPFILFLERTVKNQRSYSQPLPAECIVPPASHLAVTHHCRVIRNLTRSAATILRPRNRFEGAPMRILIRITCTGFAIVILTLTTNLAVRAQTLINDRFATVNAIRLHYLIAGRGNP